MPEILNIFYEEPDPDRWFKFDRYPRRLIRYLFRKKKRPGGVMMIALQLVKGLDKLGIKYRFNDYNYAKKNPTELIGIIGKPHLIFEKRFKNPILFGTGIFSHPIDCPTLFEDFPNIQKILVPGPWMEKMCKPYYGNRVQFLPTGIDTSKWLDLSNSEKSIDFLIYDKILWDYEKKRKELISPILNVLDNLKVSYTIIRYGEYTHDILLKTLSQCKAAIFICEHETQGFAYQQILSTNTPIIAWDQEGFWEDPSYFPNIKYKPVSSVPYWDERCGMKFKSIQDFKSILPEFILNNDRKKFGPRDYILENLTLEKSALQYVEIYQSLI